MTTIKKISETDLPRCCRCARFRRAEDPDDATDPVHRQDRWRSRRNASPVSHSSSATNDRCLRFRRAERRPVELLQAQHTERNKDISVAIQHQSVENYRQQYGLQRLDEECCHGRFTQAVAEVITAGLEKLQDRLDEINAKLDGRRMSQTERDMKMKRGVSTSVAEAEDLIKESARATGKLGVNGSEMSQEHAQKACDFATVRQHVSQFALNAVRELLLCDGEQRGVAGVGGFTKLLEG